MLATAVACGMCVVGMGEPAGLVVHADRPGHAIPRSLYGVFFEEINHAGDGGLYAELVRNRGFEEPAGDAPIPGWSLRADGTKTTLRVKHEHPAGPGAGNYLEAEIDVGGRATIVNDGYWGIALRRGETYLLRLDARRSPELGGALDVALETPDGTALASATINGLAGEWGRFEAEIVSPVDLDDARLAISVPAISASAGTLWLDTVSLVPRSTWKARRFGMRRDLGELVDRLAPAFVRFPGGCYVEGGDRLRDAFRWPATVGDIRARPGHMNANWKYWSTDGLGFHEYLQWCEDLGAEAMYVVNCGLSHKEAVPLEEIQPWIDEALNAIEYAIGPADSRFGAMRASNGHPGPFPLKYVEIGNENGMFTGFGGTREQYTERYRKFYDAIKARYPQIVTIANTRVNAPMEVVDDHFYNSPRWFWEHAALYDTTDRAGPRVYVGEYAVTSGCGTGNLAAALGEAAFMTGLERNSDVVVMASYAPMFVHARNRAWNPDMIVFDGRRAFGTPSYYVQAMFAGNRPDTLLPVDVPRIEVEPSIARGSVGLGTWNTSAEFRDVEIRRDGRTVYRSDFDSGTGGWRFVAGDWKTGAGTLRQNAIGEKHLALLDLPELAEQSDYTIRLKARKLSGSEGFLILFRTRDAEHFTWWNIGGWNNREHAIERNDGGDRSEIGTHVRGSVETGRWYDVRVELRGRNVRCFLDGDAVYDETERGEPRFAAVAWKMDGTGEIVLKVVNGGDTPLAIPVELRGVRALEPDALATVLSSGSLADENSFETPGSVVPSPARVRVEGPAFVHEFPARSLTVLRVRPKR